VVVTRPAATSQPAPPVAPPPAQLASAAPRPDLPVPDLPQSEAAAAAPVMTPAAAPPALRDAYAQTLWRHIAACKPPGARRAGVTVVRFGVDHDGGVYGLAVAQSSGSASLDAIALRSVRRAAPLPRPPAELGDDLQFSLPFSFG
jgi:protein TonB